MTNHLHEIVNHLAEQCLKHGYKIAAAESCTGGWLAHAIVSKAGSSQWFEGSIVSYSDAAKTAWLDIPSQVIAEHGAVSETVARLMVKGVLASSQATHAVSITGYAGPEGEHIGLVWFAWGKRDGSIHATPHQLVGDRTQIREQAVLIALEGLLSSG